MPGECAAPHTPEEEGSGVVGQGERAWGAGDRDGGLVGIDTTKPSVSRVYDALLGGSHNFAADRDAAGELLAWEPLARVYARANREFLWRAVRYLLDAGVRQLIDLGSGIPTVGNVHEIAQRVTPVARVVYVDVDPVAVEHSRQILDDAYATAIQVDLRRPEVVVNHPETRRLIDFAEPVGLLAVAVLHFVPDGDDPAAILARYRRLLAPGSFLALSHACPWEDSPRAAAARDLYAATVSPLALRTPQEVSELLTGWVLVPPGLVEVTGWRPEDEQAVRSVPGVAAVGRLPDMATPDSVDR